MKHMVTFLSVVLMSSVVYAAGPNEPFTYTQAAVNPSRTVIVGVTLGSSWNGFPDVIMTDFEPDYFFETLDITPELYVNWILDTADPAYRTTTRLAGPVPLRLFSWFWNNYADFEVAELGIGVQGYTTCPQNGGLEAPQFGDHPLTSDGRMHISDIHGGVGVFTQVFLADCRPGPGDPDCGELYVIMLGWISPGTYPDWTQPVPPLVNRAPGDVFTMAANTQHGSTVYWSHFDMRVVEWVSSDIGALSGPSPSPRVVNEDDLAVLSSQLGQPLRWGFLDENPPSSPNWNCDLATWGIPGINSSDLSMYAADAGEQCLLTKPDTRSEVAAMLEWFGIAATGRMVDVGPPGQTMLIPEYDVVDWARNRQAITNPSGFRTNLNSNSAQVAPWGFVKDLYR